MELEELQTLLQSAEPAMQLVEPRILRRVIRLDRRLPGLRFHLPHEQCYTIDRDRLLAFVDLGDLGVSPTSDLPRRIILLPRPDDDELGDAGRAPGLLVRCARLLFHGGIHLDLENQLARRAGPEAWAAERREQLGNIEFAEVLDVLLKDDALFPPPRDIDTYIEFAATALELKYFAPQERGVYFPAIRDWEAADRIISQDLNPESHFEQVRRIESAARASLAPLAVKPSQEFETAPSPSGGRVNLAMFRQLQARAERAAAAGNSVKAVLSHLRAARRAPAGYDAEAQAASHSELLRLTQRLQSVLHLSDHETELWNQALRPLLPAAADGFWSNEARLLYDLQKVCVEQERGVYRLDLVEWIRTRGRRPLRRPLPLMQDVLILGHLRTVRRRVSVARVSSAERVQLAELLEQVLPRLESRLRRRIGWILLDAFDGVGLPPRNVPERVGRQKLIEELLDRIVERGYFSMSDLRDALSKNDLKLSDVTTISELAFGDALLRVDRRCDVALDGVYRRGAVYQRLPQKLSSLFFGTNFGRWLTQYLFVPFGGAYLTLEFVRHLVAKMSDEPVPANAQGTTVPVAQTAASSWDGSFIVGVLLLGIWISLMIHRPDFRAWNFSVLARTWRVIRTLLIDFPSRVLRSEYVQRILESRAFAVVRNYVLEPGLITGFISLLFWIYGSPWSGRGIFELYLATALVWNSPVGRYTSELTADILMRTWHDLKIHVFAALVHWIMDVFDGLLTALERAVYTVDEWLRFRAGDNRAMQSVKAAGGVVWFFVSYVVMFVFTLLVEPQINPIKHFPVVTVAHKLILPTGPMLVSQLTAWFHIGKAEANTLVWTTIWLIPGVFGYLVWELKENWRLYESNRPRRLGPDVVGHHGETMVQLVRPGFHSGTLPKAFAALRREVRKAKPADEHRLQRKRAKIQRVEVAARRFVERELLFLLDEVQFLPDTALTVGSVHAATNRIDVELLRADRPERPALLTWEHSAGMLIGTVEPAWIEQLSDADRQTLTYALAGLFQRSGADQVQGPMRIGVKPTFPWVEWAALWTQPDELDSQNPSIGTRHRRASRVGEDSVL